MRAEVKSQADADTEVNSVMDMDMNIGADAELFMDVE